MNRHLCRLLCALVILFTLGIPDHARAAAGRVQGTITDQTGAAVRGATVEVRGVDSGFEQSTVSDGTGRYAFEGLPEGRYRVSAVSTGFEKSFRTDVALAPGRDANVDFVLAITRQALAVVVTAPAPAVEPDAIVPGRARTSDTASLLDGVPGVSLLGGGGLSSLPAIHGLADDRVRVLVNGMSIESACSNHMNPPLSYVDPASIGSITVMAGITPVSRGGDSIGGTVTVDSPRPTFAQAGDRLLAQGSLSLYHRGNGATDGGNAYVSIATTSVRFAYTASYVNAGNYSGGGGSMVKSTFYESANHVVQMATRLGTGLLTVDLGVQRIPQQGFVNARMDMTSNRAISVNGHYENDFRWGSLGARVYHTRTTHQMNILRDKVPGMNMPMNTEGTSFGYSIQGDVALSPRDTLRVGSEVQRSTLDDWWPPVTTLVGSMGPDTLWNVNNGRRSRLGTYGEWESKRSDTWTTLLGLRSDIVRMDTGNVAGYNMSTTTTGSAAYYADAVEFNAVGHARGDNNLDVTAMTRFEPVPAASFEIGYARKTRSPNLYERYLWVKRSNMSVQMNGWSGDANGYAGNIDLLPERADTLSATAGWHNGAKRDRELKVTPYYTVVHDYIDVDRCPVIAGSNGCTAAKLAATTGFVNLRFANHDARLYGVDVTGRAVLLRDPSVGAFTLTGAVGYVRGRNLDTGDNLYRMMPLTSTLTLEHTRGRWSSAVGVQAVAAKTDVQAVRIELTTPSYTVVNVRSSYQWEHLRFDVGVENLLDRSYLLPLGGRYWVNDKTGSSSVPGMGRSAFGGLTVTF
jgi:iron complex outermembrane receptor protein